MSYPKYRKNWTSQHELLSRYPKALIYNELYREGMEMSFNREVSSEHFGPIGDIFFLRYFLQYYVNYFMHFRAEKVSTCKKLASGYSKVQK